MKDAILDLLNTANMSANELRGMLNVRHETIYMALVQMEAEGRVTVWAKSRPDMTLWCKTEVVV